MNNRPIPRYHQGGKFTLSQEALENYGEEFRGMVYTVEQWYDHYVSSAWLKEHGWNTADPHGSPGFDSGATSCLYGSTFPKGDLYEWEMKRVESDTINSTIS